MTVKPRPFCIMHLYGNSLDPERVSLRLGFHGGTASHKAGAVHPRSGKRYARGYWCLSSLPFVNSHELEAHLSWFQKNVSSDAIREMGDVEEALITLGVNAYDIDIDYNVPQQFVGYAAAIGAAICIAVSYVSEEDEEAHND